MDTIDDLIKEVRDFSTKHLYQISKFNTSIFKKMLSYIDDNEIEFYVSYIDIENSLNVLDMKINSIRVEPLDPYLKVPLIEKQKSYNIKEMVITAIIYLKKDLPKALKLNEMRDHSIERLMRKNDSEVLRENYRYLINLKESKILYMIEYCMNVYKTIYNLLKRK